MRRTVGVVLFSAAIAAASMIATPVLWAQDVPYEREMWPIENRFVAAFIAGDVEGLDAMWHDDLSYWPDGEDRPWSKRYAHKVLNQWSGAADGALSTPMLEPIAAKVMDDLAVTHYRLEYTVTGNDGSTAQRRIRLTHTWIKVGDDWELLGGSNTKIGD